jgi:hypothetical protein
MEQTNKEYKVYTPTPTLTFYLFEKKTIIKTPLQTFIIQYDHRNYMKQLERLRTLITNNKMKTIIDLIEYCNFRAGNYHDQMAGLEMVPTRLERHL